MKRISTLLTGLTLVLAALCNSACAGLQRSNASGYAYADQEASASRSRRALDRSVTALELGQDSDAPEDIDRRIALRKAEKALEGKREREQYFKNKPYMRNDSERLSFLAQDTLDERARWLNSRNIGGPTVAHSPQMQALIDVNDITVGMTKQAVRDSWGEPETIEVAGNPMYGNERWHYSEQKSSTEGYHTEQRIIFFDSGRVSGWESH